jgi:predicted DNA-binding ArsR family transcriptional regulator
MVRVKVVNEAADLVGLLSSVDSPVKRDVFIALTSGWESEGAIANRFGDTGKAALSLLEKQDMLDSRWEPTPEGPKKLYHARYSSFKIDTTAPMIELTEALAVAMMADFEFCDKEQVLVHMASEGGVNLLDAASRLSVSQTMIRSMVKRSAKLEMKGLRVFSNGKP